MDNLMQLTRFDDRLSCLYFEKGHIEQSDKSVAYVNENQFVPIPAADLALLLLGPGTTITHRAICNLADCNCTVVWCGEEGSRFYCHGQGGTHFSVNLLRQIELACDPVARAEVVRRMYEKRFGEQVAPGTAIEVIRGKEGYRVRSAYQRAALEFGVEWTGRNYDAHDWSGGRSAQSRSVGGQRVSERTGAGGDRQRGVFARRGIRPHGQDVVVRV